MTPAPTKNWIFIFLAVVVWLLGSSDGHAQIYLQVDTTQSLNNEQQNRLNEQRLKTSADLEIDGLVMDETVTKIGRTFYDVFHMQWEAPQGVRNFTIVVKEKPARGNGAIVSVAVNDENIFEYQLQPRQEVIEEVASYVVALVTEHLMKDQLAKQLEAEGRKAREVY
ncbi:hypothetical protein EFA69_13685 [Rufibacter immobilis]|uniref:Curli production assembly/transport component CsgE n=1 Tax=Rufibacter immobilis TaxID=1348778 RepID=A0A3M9MR71_9BACT|nr:CsgE family curli-type amyloid fiber assembly protein [Rufibacter immobilis]RNI27208.1 hypothetical protein EFA69_13685 [Rufibacter immobilis]